MSNENVNVPYILVFETNKYAGNFERELCAYVTGVVGECQVGSKQAKMFFEEVSEELQDDICDLVVSQPDDRGCSRPCTIWNSGSNHGYNDVAIFFDDEPSSAILEMCVDRAKEYCDEHNIKLKAVKMINRVVTVFDTEKFSVEVK